MPRQFTEGWKSVDWKQTNQRVSKLQNLIYRFAKQGDIKKVRKLQNSLLMTLDARLLAVRKVTQDNRGKVTAGIDGVKNLTPEERLKLANDLQLTDKAAPVKRIYIPKPGKNETRPLGIPTIEDRARQALVKLVLEPEWEAYFEPNSYGFRPGRNCHDAIAQIKISLELKQKYVLDADISKCFDSINHQYLLDKLDLKGKLRQQIKAWLKAGYVAFPKSEIHKTDMGTPQGGVISPLLANIALHGLESQLKKLAEKTPQYFPSGKPKLARNRKTSLAVIRYADDFVVMHENKELLMKCVSEIEEFLKPIGLKLNNAKTRISHTFDPTLSEDGVAGFNFLGFTIIQEPTNIRSVKSNRTGNKLGFRTYIYPSKKSQTKHQKSITAILRSENDQTSLIAKLNPVISGWSRYFGVSDVYTFRTFQTHDKLLYWKLTKWVAKVGLTWSEGYPKYWRQSSSIQRFGNKDTVLYQHLDFAGSINDYVKRKVKGESSPYDGNYAYWWKRLSTSAFLTNLKKKLLSRQKGICSFCNLSFLPDDILEIHHLIPPKQGGTNDLSNLQLLHGHCHDSVHSKTKRLKQIE